MPPSLRTSFALGWRAASAQRWLIAVGLVVAGARRALGWPAVALAILVLARAAAGGLGATLTPEGALDAVVAAALSPRVLALVGGLWLASALLGAVLRVAYLAGALPALAAGVAGAPAGPRRFAEGVAWDFPRVLAVAALGFVAELAATGFGLAIGLAALRITLRAVSQGGSAPLAAAVALALTLSLAVSLLVSTLADAAVTRAAIRGEGAVPAFAAAAARVVRRPAAFLVAALFFALLAAGAALSVEAMGNAVLGFAAGAGAALLLGPQAMIAVLAGAIAAAIDLWALGTIAALACVE